MDPTTKEINEALSHYCYTVNINQRHDNEEVVYGLGAYSYQTPTRRVTVELKFNSEEQLNQFFIVIAKHYQEEQLRETSPTLQKAWEEYQILLKLSK
jgi:hypothetical protein